MRETVERIHAAALAILEGVGVSLRHPGALALLKRAGLRVEGDRVFFKPGQVQKWLALAPASFTLHARNPEHDILLGGEESHLAPGYGCPAVIAPDGRRRETVLADYLALAALVHQSGLYGLTGGILAQPNDLPAAASHLAMFLAGAWMSDRCLWAIPGEEARFRETMAAGAILFGGREAFVAKPHLLTMISTVSPLVVDRTMLDTMLVAAEHGQPLLVSPAPAAGTTGPIEPGANLALATAEALACLVLIQVAREGLPVVFGLQCYGSDLRTGQVSIGSPAYALQAAHSAALARFYHLPSRGGGAVTDAKGLTIQAGYEAMFALLAGLANRINLIVHAGGILDSFAGISYEKLMADMEMVRMVREGFCRAVTPPSREAVCELVAEVGPGGQFLTTRDTLQKCRSHSWQPWTSARGLLKDQDARGQFLASARKGMARLWDAYRPPERDQATWRGLESFAERAAGGAAGGVVALLRGAPEGSRSWLPLATGEGPAGKGGI